MNQHQQNLFKTEEPATSRHQQSGQRSTTVEQNHPKKDSVLPGYRLHHFEVLNWGTFDGKVHSMQLKGATALLVGQNGCGKSTLVDAILTLLVKPGVRNFNVAAGAKKRERTERTYYEGAFDRTADSDGLGIKTQCLRQKKDHCSVLLACFKNSETGQSFTSAQVLYWNGQNVEKIYCFSKDERSIKKDFSSLNSSEGILKTLKKRGFQASKTFADYERWFRKTTHVKKKAMEIFNQTVAVKDIQNLNDFIRKHMLESYNRSERVDALLAHFTELNEAHRCLVRVRQQSNLLEPVAKVGVKFQSKSRELAIAEKLVSAIDPYFDDQIIKLFSPELEQCERRVNELQKQNSHFVNQIEKTQQQQRSLENEIQNAGGGRLKEIPLLIKAEQIEVSNKRDASARYNAALARMGVKGKSRSEQQFISQRSQVPSMRIEREEQLQKHEGQRVQFTVDREVLSRQLEENRNELEGLSKRKENLPEWLVLLRKQLCDELRLPISELFFVAELIAVKADARDWEPSIEKVLHGFAMSLLVPDQYYQQVSTYVEQTKLISAKQGRRLVYLRVKQQSAQVEPQRPDRQSILNKLEYRRGNSIIHWVQSELERRYDYLCCETIEEFQQHRGKAMTRSLHIKAGVQRHEKDDRARISNPRNFILGWDNINKKRCIAQEIERSTEKEDMLNSQINQIESEINKLRDQLSALSELDRFENHFEIAFEPHEERIKTLDLEKQSIEENDDCIKTLKQHLAETNQEQKELQDKRDDIIRQETILQREIKQATILITNAKSHLKELDSQKLLDEHRKYFPHYEPYLKKITLTIENFFDTKTRIQQLVTKQDVDLRKKLDPIKEKLIQAMSHYLKQFPEESDLATEIKYLGDFLERREEIIREDLPRHEQRFKERLNEKVTHEIGLFRGALETERREVVDKIETLNQSLRQLEYRPDKYIQLDPKLVRHPEIVEFKQQLEQCISQSFEDSLEANEERFKKIQQLVTKLQDEKHRRWRDKVTDVRQWFDFVANVIDQQSLESVSSYDDSTGQSGGEKAKLAFTILVAAIAYQYDLDPEHGANNRFQFVVVDEMFSKVDDQHAEYALELFKQFGLQLLIVAPLDAKARVTQPYVGCYLHINKKENKSKVLQMSATEFNQIAEQSSTHGLPNKFISKPK